MRKGLLFILGLIAFSQNSLATGTPPGVEPPADSLSDVLTSFDNFVDHIYFEVGDSSLTKEALSFGLKGYYALKSQDQLKDTSKLTIVDFTKSTNEERMYVIDLVSLELVWKSVVTHGQKTGGRYARHFSNTQDSHQSSIGFYVTGQRWNDSRLGECLQLYGREYSNWKALTRGIIVHSADYASCDWYKRYGEIGRSYGCPAVPNEGYDELLDIIDEGTCYFIYFPDWKYKQYSKLLNRYDYLIEFGQDLGFLR